MDKLEPQDDVMADRGFNIRDMVTKKRATLNIPPFAKGKSLSTKACTKTRRIAALRIHVERAIQRLKCFQILRGVMPITLAAVADQTVFVCAALCNLMKPLTSFKVNSYVDTNILCFIRNVWFQKLPILPPQKGWEILVGGRGLKGQGN